MTEWSQGTEKDMLIITKPFDTSLSFFHYTCFLALVRWRWMGRDVIHFDFDTPLEQTTMP